MHFVHFAFVTKKSTTIGEALEFLAAFDSALVWSIVLVHMFAGIKLDSITICTWGENTPPFALAIKEKTSAFFMSADHFPIMIAERLFSAFVAVILP